jgi:isoleucyl-tRNA synthetase
MKKSQFEPISPHVHFPEIEEKIASFWNDHDVFKKSLENTENKKEFVFFDGPPFATGLPHYGHLLAGTIKDIIPRYWTMSGRHVGRRFGWDCHGLPVENEMEKELKVSGKKDIEKLGIHFFNEACRSIVLRYTSQWETIVNRMGRWVDFEHQYRTMDSTYMESIWWVFSRVWESDLIHQGFRVQPYCPRCATPLSNFEVTEGYKETQSPSITVTFPLADKPNVKFLVWTTTPWTLPSNVALAVGPDIRYVRLKDGDTDYILAKDRVSAYYKDPGTITILEEMPGSDLVGLAYEPMFGYFKDKSDGFFRVTTGDFVSTEDGAGIVHIAPAFGEDDFGVGQRLELPIVCPVDEEGKFTQDVPDYAGRKVHETDDDIIRAIKAMGRLVHRTTLQHRYPFCPRCDTALIYKAITTWFLKIAPLKANMLDNNKRIRWVPPHLQNGRFGKGVESAPDWNISRNRYWGTPIPLWLCDCGHKECVGSISALHLLAGGGNEAAGRKIHLETIRKVSEDIRKNAAETIDAFNINTAWKEKMERVEIPSMDIHRHIVDTFVIKCPQCGETMKRTPEVLDCWFESGSMPYAQLHYPFENNDVFDARFPADFIAEGLDQTRGWFYTLTVLAAALFRKEAFKNVIVNGIILAEDGKKLSKRLKNYAPVGEVLDKFGADALRLFLVNSPAVKAEDLRFSENGVLEMTRAVLLPFWNAFSFFVTYANVDGFEPKSDRPPEGVSGLDLWVVSLLHTSIKRIRKEMESYNLYNVVPVLVDFIDNLTNWYIRRSRRRFWKSENDIDKMKAYSTLYYVVLTFSKVLAPVLPYIAEVIYQNLSAPLPEKKESVHLETYPDADNLTAHEATVSTMRQIRQVVTMGHALRARFVIKNRQPLSKVTVIIRPLAESSRLQEYSELIMDELNVKKVEFSDNEDSVVTVSAKANFKKLGKVFGARMKDAAKIIEAFDHADIKTLESGASIDVLGTAIALSDIDFRRSKHAGMEVETQEGMTVALNTEITRDLQEECTAREFVNRVQTLRKKKEFAVTDRIDIRFECPEEIKDALRTFDTYIRNETLAVSVEWAVAAKGAEKVEINGSPVSLDIRIAEAA